MKKKILTLSLVVALAATAIIGGTLAYFTDNDDVKNTFTVGDVEIKLDETDVDLYGVKDGETRTEAGNEYKLIPGHTYVKDPTVTVEKGSEPCYVRMFVTFNKATALETLFPSFLPQNFVEGWDANVWKTTNDVTRHNDTLTYEFRYFEVVDARDADANVVLDALFDTFTLPAHLTDEQVATLEDLEITVYAEAIQANDLGGTTPWDALDAQK